MTTSSTDKFLIAFFEVDKDESEEITIDELQDYMNEHNYETGFVDKWLDIFDQNKDGKITLEEYCDTLGLVHKQAQEFRRKYSMAAPPRMPDDVEVLREDMTLDNELEVIRITREALAQFEKEEEITQFMKRKLESKLGRLWHVVIILGQYWIYYSYEPRYTFHFKLGKHIFLVWKTPAE